MLSRVETEKLSFNLSAAELGQMELLIASGLYTSKSDVIRTALRRLFEHHADVVTRAVKGSAGIGYFRITRESLETSRDRGERQLINIIGVLEFDDDITAELADLTIENIKIHGVLRADPAIKERLRDRIQGGRGSRRHADQ
jgi:Arc/MetJ-type ribon-helix-helix transcriptional regulator